MLSGAGASSVTTAVSRKRIRKNGGLCCAESLLVMAYHSRASHKTASDSKVPLERGSNIKDDAFFMLMLRNSARDKRDPEQHEAKTILKKIETDSKLTPKDDRWIASFKCKHTVDRRPAELDYDNNEYQFDEDLVSPERAIETYSKDAKEPDDQQYELIRDKFFTRDTIEDIFAESVRKTEQLKQELVALIASATSDEYTRLVDQLRKEEETQKKNTSVNVWSIDFSKIHESVELQNHVVRCERILLRQFFHAHFLPGQLLSIICALTRACDCVSSMRTGGGKTMIFAIPALLEDQKTTIVFSPLRSLILDQMNEMKKLGIESGYLMSEAEMKKIGEYSRISVLRRLTEGKLRVLFTTPEQAFSNSCMPYMKEMMAKKMISRIVVDEAHLLRQWESFRTQFQNFGNLRSCFPGVPMILMTACLPRETRSHLSSQIGFKNVMINRCLANRRNAFYMVQRKICDIFEGASSLKDEYRKIRGPTLDRLVALLRGPFRGASAIIYCRTAKLTGILSNYLRENICETAARHFNAQLSQEERLDNQRHWTESTVPIMVATCAFGLGINHPHVRLVVHWDMPQTLDDYFQQAGRAGRDGAPCLILSFYNPNDLDGTLSLGVSHPNRSVEVACFMENQIFCRRTLILSEYAEPCPPQMCRTSCDVCHYKKTWSLYDISRFANNLLALVVFLPHHIEPLDVKQHPFRWLVSLLRGDIKAIRTLLNNSHAASLCKTGIIPGCGSMKNLCKDDAFTIVLSLFEHGVFTVMKQEGKSYGRGQLSHSWKILPGENLFCNEMSTCKSEQYSRLVKPRFTGPMLIPLPTATIQRLQSPVLGTWGENPDHAMFCGWCKERCFSPSGGDASFEVRQYPCAPILAHKECIDDEHDDEENRKKYDDPENCMLCRNLDVFVDGRKKGRGNENRNELILCYSCNRGTCHSCLITFYELDDETIKILTSVESAKWFCASCDPFTVPLCYQWYRAEKILESRGQKDVTFRKRDDPMDLLTALLQQTQSQCERALQFCERNIEFMENDLMPLEKTSDGKFPLFSFVTLNDYGSVKHYYMVMSHSNAGSFVYVVEFLINPRSNALQPPKPHVHDLFDEKLLLRMECHKIKQIDVDAEHIIRVDGTSNIWCPLNTINKIRRDLISKIKSKQRYRWTPLEILAAPKSEIDGDPKRNSEKSECPVISPSDKKRLLQMNAVDSIEQREKSTRGNISNRYLREPKNSSSLLMKRGSPNQESPTNKSQKFVDPSTLTSVSLSNCSKLEDALHRTSNDSKFVFDRKDGKLSFDVLMVSFFSRNIEALPIDLAAARISQTCLAGPDYGEFSIYHAIFLAMYQAALPVRSSDIALMLQSMGLSMLYHDSASFAAVIQNTLHNHHRDFPCGIFQCKNQYWFLNPETFNPKYALKKVFNATDCGHANPSLEDCDNIHTAAASFGRCLRICPNTFLKVEAHADEWYCMVTTQKDTGKWYRIVHDDDGTHTQVLVRWFVLRKDGKASYGAKELLAHEGGTDQAWDWVSTSAILEVIFVKWGLLEPHEKNWFEFYYTKNINTFEVYSGPGKKSKSEKCISDCNPVRFQADFWDHDLLEFQNPDPYQSKLYVDLESSEDLFDKSFLSRISMTPSQISTHGTFELLQDRTHLNLLCAHSLMSRHYPHSSSTKFNIRNCHLFQFAELIEAVIFALLQNQFPMNFQTLCDKIGVPSKFRGDLNSFCKNALSPDIFLIGVFVDACGHRSKGEYISLKMWEAAFQAFRKFDRDSSIADHVTFNRAGITWKRAFETVSKLHPGASILYRCAVIANVFPGLCERQLKSDISESSAAAAYCLHEIAVHLDGEADSTCAVAASTDPDFLKIMKSAALFRDVMESPVMQSHTWRQQIRRQAPPAKKPKVPSATEANDCILITSDEEPAVMVIDVETDDDDVDVRCDKNQFSMLHRKRTLKALKTEDIDTRDSFKLGPDDPIIFQFAFLFCLKSLQSNLKFTLSSVRDKILHLFSQCSNAMALAERAAISLQDKNILVYNSSEKECDPSPCFQLNMDKGLVVSLANSSKMHETAKNSGNADGNKAQLLKTSHCENYQLLSKARFEFSFVAPPDCQSFQDQQVFLRYHAELNTTSPGSVTQFTSLYSHFTDFEAATSYLKTLDDDETKHACSNCAHPIVQLIEGKLEDMVLQENVDDDDVEFEEHLSIRPDDDIHPEVFKPYCQRPDPNIPDYRRKIETFLKLDFEVAYSIEQYISSGGLLWNALDYQDLEKMERYSDELVEARKSNSRDKYVLVLNKIKVQLCNKVNMERMKSQSALDYIEEMTLLVNKKSNDRKKIASEDVQAMERCTVFSGFFHEHRGVKLKPSVYGKFSCRAYRKFGSHRFITVSIPKSATPERVKCLLNHGFKTIVGDRLYQFVPSGDSHLKERKLMFFAVSGQHLEPFLPHSFLQWHIPMSRDPHSEYFPNSEIISIKFFARFQLCFSASAVAMTLSAEEYEYIDDIEVEIPGTSKTSCATDGCGLAPLAFFIKIKEAFKLAYVPSCVQIRFGGCKGLLHVDTRVSKVQFRRKSQRKYVCDDSAIEQRQVEVTSWSPSHQASTADMSAKLNLQLAFVLRSMGVPDEFFYSLLKHTRELVLGAIGKGLSEKLHRDAALEFVQKFKGMPHCEEIRQILEQNILDVTHPYIVRALRNTIDLLLNPIQMSFHMPVPEMKFLYGVPDPTGILKYGQCFVLLGEPADGAIHRRFEDTEVLVGRNPMQHPGDVRKLTAVFVPELYNMKLCNVIVFPVQGNPETGQLLNDEMSGGDFDGDQYIFIWNKDVTKSAMQHDPYPYYLDGKPLTKSVASFDPSSICTGSSDSKDSVDVVSAELSMSDRTIDAENSNVPIVDNHHHEQFEVSNVTIDAHSTVPADHAEPQSSFEANVDLTQARTLSRNPVASSDPAKWTTDDVKAHFNNKIGICPEEAYEKLKLCALGVICHWDNNLGRLCNLQRDIADFSLHEAKMSGSDNQRMNGFADPSCMEIAPLVARAVDSLKTGEIVRIPKKFSKTAEHWLKSSGKCKHKEGSTYNSSSLFGVISKDISDLQHLVLQFVQSNSYEAVNSQLIESMCRAQHRVEVTQLVQKVRKRIDEEFHLIFESASHLDAGARSQHMTEGINRMCKEQEEFVRQNLTEKGYGANLLEYIKMFVGLLYQTCYADMRRLSVSDGSFGSRKAAKDSNEDPDIQAIEKRAERDSSSKWTLVQLPFKIFHPVLQTNIKSFNDLKQHVARQ